MSTASAVASNVLTASDWLAFVGVIVAAVLGVGVAIWGQWRARVAAKNDALDKALVSVILALGQRAIDLEEWAAPAPVPLVGSMGGVYVRPGQGDEAGGPPDALLQTAVEAAWLIAPTTRERKCVEALADATFHLKAAPVRWQVARAGQIAASIRSWRTATFADAEFRRNMASHVEAAHATAPAASSN